MLAGAEIGIDTFKLPAKQEADAAPRWAQVDQKIALWDYAASDQLQGDGTAPLNVYFRVPPDIFYDDRPNAVLHLVYRYNSIPIGPISSMQVRVNDAFLGSIPLVPGQETSRKMETELAVPVVNLRPFSNSLSFDFTFQLLKKGGCQDTTPINMQGAILRDSYIDLRGYPHYTPLPNLELFANSGYPFTRFADLGGTTVVLPHQPNAQEIEAFVTLMGHFGRQTGFPALRVAVDGPDALHMGSMQDFLVIGTDNDQPGFEKLGGDLPVALRSGEIQVHDTQGFFAKMFHNAWWKLKTNDHTESGDLTASGVPDAVIEGIESPYDPGGNRSIVAIHLRQAENFEPFMDTLMKIQQSSDVSGSVAVLHGTQFQSFRIGSDVYHVGTVPWWTRIQLWLRQIPWLVAVIVLLLAFLVAVWARQGLRARARSRLRMIED
jgi:cellulose synthase (UDP-forming)